MHGLTHLTSESLQLDYSPEVRICLMANLVYLAYLPTAIHLLDYTEWSIHLAIPESITWLSVILPLELPVPNPASL